MQVEFCYVALTGRACHVALVSYSLRFVTLKTQNKVLDPLSKTLYASLGRAEKLVDLIFYCAAILSFAVLGLSRQESPLLYDVVQSIFVLSVIVMFFGGLAVRLYFSSRAHDGRIADFVSNSYQVKLAEHVSSGYYSTTQKEPVARMAASLLENVFFTKEISRLMLFRERLGIVCYSVLWGMFVLYRQTDLALVAAAAQVLFGEQLLSKWIRLEWLRGRCESIFSRLFALLQTSSDKSAVFHAMVIEQLVLYEVSKTQAAISMSSRIFKKRNPSLTERWEKLSATLALN